MTDRKSAQITLSVEADAKTKATIMSVSQAFDDLNKNAESLNYDAALKDLEKLNASLVRATKNQKNNKTELDAYNTSMKTALRGVDKQIERILYTQTQAGRADLERLKALKKESEARKLTNKELREIEKIESQIAVGTDEELKKQLQEAKQYKIRLRYAQQQMKVQIQINQLGKTARDLAREDIKLWRDRVKAVTEYWRGLSKSGKAYAALKTTGKALTKTFMIGGAAAIGTGAALTGAAFASAGAQIEKEMALHRFGGPLAEDEKSAVLSDLRIRTGADYTRIVEAINSVQTLLGKNISKADLMTATIAELRQPGAAALFQTQTAAASAEDLATYANRMRAIQKETGASIEQVSQAAAFASNIKNRQISTASQSDIQALYLALQASGAFDNDADMEKAFNRFLTLQARSGENIYEFAQKYDWTRGKWQQTARNQITSGIASIDFSALSAAAQKTDSELKMSAAERAAADLRRFEERKNQFLQHVLEKTVPMIERFMNWARVTLPGFITSTLKFFNADESTIKASQRLEQQIREELQEEKRPLEQKTIALIDEWTDKGVFHEGNRELVKYIVEEMGKAVTVEDLEKTLKRLNIYEEVQKKDVVEDTSLQQKAMGGIYRGPALVGERGSELNLALPLDHDKAARANNIIQNVTQTITLQNSPSSLSFSQAIKSKGFNKSAFLGSIQPL